MSEFSNKKNIVITSIAVLVLGVGFFFSAKAPAPTVETLGNFWRIYSDSGRGIQFKYPELSNKFVIPQEWPPKVSLISEVFSCNEYLDENQYFKKVVKKQINGSIYCLETKSEGAAGSVYTTYNYKKDLNNGRVLDLNFVLKYPRCENYEEPNKTDCVLENENIDIDQIASDILESVVVK